MLKSLAEPEMSEYIWKFSWLVNLLNESSSRNNSLNGVQHLTDCISLLKFKIETGLMNELKIDSESGIVSFGNIADLIAEKSNVGLKLDHSYSPEKIRDRLIKEFDSTESAQDFDLSGTVASLANRYYLSMLQKASIDEDIKLDAHLAESGESDLIRIVTSGYCLPLSAFCSYEIDLYVQKKKILKKIRIGSQGEVSLPEEFRNKLSGWFGIQSNIVYEFINLEKAFEPRRVKRTVFAPFYSRFFQAGKMAKEVDPHFLEICREVLPASKAYILSVHTDISTKYFDPSAEAGSQNSKPNINIEHRYFCSDRRAAKKLEEYVPKNEIVSPDVK